jgi:hypothetical protein
MLRRQAQRLLTYSDSLCGQVLKAKYFPHTNILHCTPKDKMSYRWRSILKGLELLKEGLIWRIGNEERVRIWDDPWLPKGLTRKPITPRRASILTRVNGLINPLTGDWDVELIQDNFLPEDAEEILRIPIDMDMDDWPAWYFDTKGIFPVKSTYKLAVSRRNAIAGKNASTSGSKTNEGDFQWHKLWMLEVPSKVQMFIWRLAHNSLPVGRNVTR